MKIVLRYQPEPEDFALLRQAAPSAEFVVCTDDGALAGVLADANVLIGGMGLTDAMVNAAPALTWVQSTFTGVESFLAPALLSRGISLTNFRGVPAAALADHAMALMLAFARGLPELARYQARGAWRMRATGMLGFDLTGQRLGIVGFGAIGRALAKRARSFDMDVWAVRRTHGDEHPDVSRMLTLDGMPKLLAACDHVVLALPSTPETKGLMTSKLFAHMRPSSFFYNVARGDLVDQDALIAALSQGRLAGAGLDVTTPEPLPQDSPLWTMPNVIITAHTGGNSSSYFKRGTALLVENLTRYQAGETLLNIVDLKHGY
jgi:phosphoglycerate dehydrogenase-like enzyme